MPGAGLVNSQNIRCQESGSGYSGGSPLPGQTLDRPTLLQKPTMSVETNDTLANLNSPTLLLPKEKRHG